MIGGASVWAETRKQAKDRMRMGRRSGIMQCFGGGKVRDRAGFSSMGQGPAADGECRQIEIRSAPQCEVAKELTRQTTEFKAMPAARAGDDDMGMIGMKVDDKVLIGRIGIHAHGGMAKDRLDSQTFDRQCPYLVYLILAGLLAQFIRRNNAPAMVPGELCSATKVGEAIEHFAAQVFPDEDRHVGGLEICAPGRIGIVKAEEPPPPYGEREF